MGLDLMVNGPLDLMVNGPLDPMVNIPLDLMVNGPLDLMVNRAATDRQAEPAAAAPATNAGSLGRQTRWSNQTKRSN